MSYASVGALQNTLSEKVFHYATDRKKSMDYERWKNS